MTSDKVTMLIDQTLEGFAKGTPRAPLLANCPSWRTKPAAAAVKTLEIKEPITTLLVIQNHQTEPLTSEVLYHLRDAAGSDVWLHRVFTKHGQ